MTWSREEIISNMQRLFVDKTIDVIGDKQPFQIQVAKSGGSFDKNSLKSSWSREGKDYKMYAFCRTPFSHGSLTLVCFVLTKKLARQLSNYSTGDLIATFSKFDNTVNHTMYIRLELLSTGKQTLVEI